MGTNYIAPIWRMPKNTNKDKLSNYNIEFDGSRIQMPFTELSGATNCTISFWAKIDYSANVEPKYPFHLTNGTDNPILWVFNAAGTALDVYIGNVNFRLDGSFNKDIAEWNHWVLRFDGSETSINRTRVYQNGQQLTSQSGWGTATSIPSATNLILAGRNLNATQWYYQMPGNMSQCCIFDYTLSEDQINYLYNLNNPMAISGAEPIAYYPIGDNSNPNATAGYPNISVGANSVFDFVESNTQYIDIGTNNSVLMPTDEMSISLWVKFSAAAMGNTRGLFSANSASGYNGYVIWKDNNDKIAFLINDGSWKTATRPTAVVQDVWYHVVGTWNGSTSRIYVNNVDEANVSVSSIVYNASTVNRIGDYANDEMDGNMANVQFWNKELSASEVTTLYNSGVPLLTGTQPQEANLKAWYKLDQSANWEADTAGNWQIPDAVSSYPQSFNFDLQDYIEVPQINTTGAISISGWVKTTDANYNMIYNEDEALRSGGNRNLFFSTVGSLLRLNLRFDTGTSVTVNTSGVTLNDGNWHHVAGVWNGTTDSNEIKLFVDGILRGQGTATETTRKNFTILGNIGGSNATYDMNGQLSNIQTYTTGLTYGSASSLGDTAGGQIAELYNNGVPLTTAIASDNLKLWAKLDNTETFTQNASGNEGWAVFNNTASPAITGTAISELNGSVNPGPYGGFNYFGWRAANYSDPTNYHSLPTTHLGFSCWYKYQGPTIPAGNATRYIFAATSASYYMTFTLNDNGSFRIYGDASNRYVSSSSSELTNGEWHNICVYMPNSTTNNASDIKLWIDGVEKNLSPSSGFTTYPQKTLWLGAYNYSGGGTAPRSDSFYDYVIYDTDISNDVSTIYNNGVPTDVSILNPYAYYKFDSTNITFVSNRFELTDLSGNNRNAFGPYRSSNDTPRLKSNSIRGGSSRSSGMTEQNLVNNNVSALNGESVGMNTTNLVTSNLTRKQPYSNYSFNFDQGASDYFNCSNVSVLQNASVITWNLWVNFHTRDFNIVFGKALNTTDVIQFYTWGAGAGYFWLKTAGSPVTAYISNLVPGRVALNEWAMFTIVFDGSQSGNDRLKIYQNGGATNIITSYSGTTPATLPNTTDDFFIGRGYNGYFDGKISNLAIWDSVLNNDDRINLYNNGVPQDLNNFRIQPVNWWPLDENSSYYGGADWITRDVKSGQDGDGNNTGNVDDLVGNAPGSEASGTGTNLTIADLKANMSSSDKNAYSINMGDYADGVTNPANSGRSTNVP